MKVVLISLAEPLMTRDSNTDSCAQNRPGRGFLGLGDRRASGNRSYCSRPRGL
jgi:hypothetical protein